MYIRIISTQSHILWKHSRVVMSYLCFILKVLSPLMFPSCSPYASRMIQESLDIS